MSDLKISPGGQGSLQGSALPAPCSPGWGCPPTTFLRGCGWKGAATCAWVALLQARSPASTSCFSPQQILHHGSFISVSWGEGGGELEVPRKETWGAP